MNFKFIHVHKLNYEIHYFQLHNLVCKSWLTLGKAYFVILRRNLLCTFSFLSVLGTLDAHGRSFNQNPSGKISMLATQCAICNNMSNIRTVFYMSRFTFITFYFKLLLNLISLQNTTTTSTKRIYMVSAVISTCFACT